jgi:hypothetical protein
MPMVQTGDTVDDGPLADPLAEARRVAHAIEQRGISVRFVGGLGVALTCDAARRSPLARTYEDLDLAGRSKERKRIIELLESLGYEADREFNALNSDRRLLLHDRRNDRSVDVFIDEAELCHTIDLRDRLDQPGPALSPADLLLLKLQVVETTRKDLTDILAILVDHEVTAEGAPGVDVSYLAALVSHDWGLWRTTTMVARRAADFATKLEGFQHAATVRARVEQLIEAFDAAPKSRGWRLRARVGDRKRWYELPEGKA